MTASSVGKRRSLFFLRKCQNRVSFIGEHFRGPGFWSFFVWNDMSRSVCQWATLCLRKNLTLTEGKKGGNLMYAARQKSCTQRIAETVLMGIMGTWLPAGWNKETKQTNECNRDQKRKRCECKRLQTADLQITHSTVCRSPGGKHENNGVGFNLVMFFLLSLLSLIRRGSLQSQRRETACDWPC